MPIRWVAKGVGLGAGAALGNQLANSMMNNRNRNNQNNQNNQQFQQEPQVIQSQQGFQCECGAICEPSWKFCGGCARSLVPPTCSSCSSTNEAGDKFCRSCGTAL